jgi:transcriptional regulator NrdR family protein
VPGPERIKARIACPKCGRNTAVIESMGDGEKRAVMRWRACLTCQVKFKTREERDETVPLAKINWSRTA